MADEPTNGASEIKTADEKARRNEKALENRAYSHPDEVLVRFIRLCSTTMASQTFPEAAAFIVNRISDLIRCDRAVLVRMTGKEAIVSVTGGGVTAQDSSFADAVSAVRKEYRNSQDPIAVPPAHEFPGIGDHLINVQEAMGKTNILWLPLWLKKGKESSTEYALWLERWRNAPWEKQDIELLHHVALFLGHALVQPKKNVISASGRWTKALVCILLLAFLMMPVSSSVTAPAKVVPDRPNYIFAPMDGILKDLYVQPGQWVEEGDILFRYDARVLEKSLEEARRNVAVARAKLARLEGAAHRDPEARAELPVQRLEVERAESDVVFYEKQLARANVRTAKNGVVVLDDPDALIGAALQTGQVVLSVADPEKTKVRIMAPAADAGLIKKGASIFIRLDSDPLRSIPAVVTRVGFDVRLSEKHVPSVIVEGIWPGEGPDVQPGQKCTAKILGPTTRLGIQIIRKPLIAIRSATGL